MDRFETSSAQSHGCTVLTALGEIDLGSVRQLDTAVSRYADSPDPLILDLSGVTFCDSTGLHLLLRVQRDAAGAHRPFAVVPSPEVKRLLELVEADRVLPTHDTLAAALTALRPPSASARLSRAG